MTATVASANGHQKSGGAALRARIRAAGDAVLRRSPAQSLWQRRSARRLVVLAYHGVTDAERFAWHVRYLSSAMHPVSLTDVTSGIVAGRPLPERAVLVTFDDGERSVLETALPILREHGVPGVVFVVPDLLDTDRPFWWREAEELVRRGGRAPGLPVHDGAAAVRALKRMPDHERRERMEQLRQSTAGIRVPERQLERAELHALEAAGIPVGNHTFTHPCLDRCTDEMLRSELVRAHDAIVDTLGAAPVAFAYPNGNFDGRAVPILRELGYQAAFLFDHRTSAFPPPDPYRISRVRISSAAHPDRFRIIASGLHSSMHRLRGRS